ncbi:MAG: metallophosphoesterase [Candidatus Eremiobacteraeota bacterium]|nr:metallophosphoesterase [Candidatus Eremiobacteraeota bacterium]
MNRERFLECMAWCGTGVVYGLTGTGMVGKALASAGKTQPGGRTFVQISDTHVGFGGAANPDVIATFQKSINLINALPQPPEFVMHTGDLTHLSKPDQFDTVKQMLGTIKAGAFYAVPGEHDVIDDRGLQFFKMFGHNADGGAREWYSFDAAGVHSLGLTNVLDIKKGGVLGRDQLEWARNDLAGQRASMPIVVFAHIPLYAVYPQWGWSTDDYLELLAMLRRFDSVTVLNGHIHQVFTKTDGNVTFYTADSTAFPQPAPGTAPHPGPLKVAAGELAKHLGVRTVTLAASSKRIAVADSSLAM